MVGFCTVEPGDTGYAWAVTAPKARFRLAGGEEADVGPGGVIGRLATATLCVDDPRVSEAHAMVSLRGGELYLLALRGPLLVQGSPVSHVHLRQGLRMELVAGIELRVVDLELPAAVLAIDGAEGGTVLLLHSVYSLRDGNPPKLVNRFEADARGWIWAAGERYRVRLAGGEARLVEPGVPIRWGASALEPCLRPLRDAGCTPTHRQSPSAALTIRARYETVHIHVEDGPSAVVSGIAAQMISELAQFDVPVPWHVVANEIWPDTGDAHLQRRNWDRNVARLRAKLREAGIREDLLRPDGCGNVELYLRPGDRVADET
jgi:hypothetical protein